MTATPTPPPFTGVTVPIDMTHEQAQHLIAAAQREREVAYMAGWRGDASIPPIDLTVTPGLSVGVVQAMQDALKRYGSVCYKLGVEDRRKAKT